MSTQLRNRLRPSRSFFFTPGSRPERFPAAHTMSWDAIIVDLESTVAPADKGRAREAALTFLREPPIADFNPSRRRFLQGAGILAGAVATFPAWADTFVNLDLPGGPDRRELTTAFPQKAQMILQRTPGRPCSRLRGMSTITACSDRLHFAPGRRKIGEYR